MITLRNTILVLVMCGYLLGCYVVIYALAFALAWGSGMPESIALALAALPGIATLPVLQPVWLLLCDAKSE